jgi:dihydrofolate synthase / folylpolyglutamate synthase
MAFDSYAAALAWLESHVDFERVAPNRAAEPSLQPIVDTLAALAHPEQDYRIVHITGTNGKGTTTTLTSALIRELGLRVGTFTSPDLHAINERVALNGTAIDDRALVGLLSRLADVESVTGVVLTRFEILTVAALLYFSDEAVDVAVIEVGLGGTWDSTNVVRGHVAVLTNVDLDHTAVLGPDVPSIARDKVGIMKDGAEVVLVTEDPDVVAIATERCALVGARLCRLGVDFFLERNDVAVGGRLLTLRTPRATYEDVALSLHGIHQGLNALGAVVAAESLLGEPVPADVVLTAFAAATMPGRLEVVGRRPLVVVDGAHNPAGVRALAQTLAGAFAVDGTRRVVLGMLHGREPADMVRPLLDAGLREFYLAPPHSPRAMAVTAVRDVLTAPGVVVREFASVAEALDAARRDATTDDLIVACGSLYLVAEVRGLLLDLPDRHLA